MMNVQEVDVALVQEQFRTDLKGGLEELFVQLLFIPQNKVDETQCGDFGPLVSLISDQEHNFSSLRISERFKV